MFHVLTMSRDIKHSCITCIRTLEESDHNCITGSVLEQTTIDYYKLKMLGEVILRGSEDDMHANLTDYDSRSLIKFIMH